MTAFALPASADLVPADHAPAPVPAPAPVLAAILDRRSSPVLREPGPTAEQVELVIRAATTVPDHGRLRPWRFLLVDGDGRGRFGDALAAGAAEVLPDPDAATLERMRQKAFVAPCLVGLVASPRPAPKVPEWEQLASAASAGYAMALTAHALGLGAVWKSVPFWDSRAMGSRLGLAPAERLLGWVNLGQRGPAPARARPEVDLAVLVDVVGRDGISPYVPPA